MIFDAATSSFTLYYRPRNRNTYITITREGEVCVRTPCNSEGKVRELLRQKEGWISDKLHHFHQNGKNSHRLGETIRYRGENIPVNHFPSLQKKIERRAKNINIEKYYIQFYREEAVLTLPSRIEYYVRKMGLRPSEIRFKKMRRRWGSCEARGIVTFNTLMMQLAYEHIDYIIVHELAHLKHMNHSKAFHDFVRLYLPEEKRLRKELKTISPL